MKRREFKITFRGGKQKHAKKILGRQKPSSSVTNHSLDYKLETVVSRFDECFVSSAILMAIERKIHLNCK